MVPSGPATLSQLAGGIVGVIGGLAVRVGDRADESLAVIGEGQGLAVGVGQADHLAAGVVTGGDPVAVRVLYVVELAAGKEGFHRPIGLANLVRAARRARGCRNRRALPRSYPLPAA